MSVHGWLAQRKATAAQAKATAAAAVAADHARAAALHAQAEQERAAAVQAQILADRTTQATVSLRVVSVPGWCRMTTMWWAGTGELASLVVLMAALASGLLIPGAGWVALFVGVAAFVGGLRLALWESSICYAVDPALDEVTPVQQAAISALVACPAAADAWVTNALAANLVVVGGRAARQEVARRQAFAFAVQDLCATVPDQDTAEYLAATAGDGDQLGHVIAAALHYRSATLS